VRALSYCDLHKVERCDLLDVMEIYPDFADSFEEKFQVTFDLRECELTEQKPTKKKMKMKMSGSHQASKRPSKSSGRSLGNTVAGNTAKLASSLDEKPPVFQIVNADQTEENFLKSSHSSMMKKLSLNEGLINTGYSLDSSNNLSASQSFLLQKQKSVSSFDSNSNLMQINSARRVSGILRKKSRLIRNASRLSPMITNMTAAAAAQRNASLSYSFNGKRQISTLSEVELEIDTLVA
jgi:hypothetical protein